MNRALVLALIALCSLALPAQAEGVGDVDVAIFTAHTTSFTPLPIEGGTGEFGFSSDLCLMASVAADGDEGGPTHPDLMCTTAMAGTYAFIVCGVGFMSGQLFINEFDPLDPSLIPQYVVNFSMTVVGGIGVLTGTASEDGGATFPDPLAGVVLLTSQQAPISGFCLTQADMQGVLASTV
jgi:hypothetical protein